MLNTTTKQDSRTSSQLIWDAVMELHNLQQPITREILAKATGLRITVIDDHTKRLVNDGELRRLLPGVFTPIVLMAPPRAISKTVLADGGVMIEIGDQVMHLTPQEDRSLAALQAGVAIQFSSIHAGQEISVLAAGFREALNAIKYGAAQKDSGTSAPSVAARKKRANPGNGIAAHALDAIIFGANLAEPTEDTTSTGDLPGTTGPLGVEPVTVCPQGENPLAPVAAETGISVSDLTAAHELQ